MILLFVDLPHVSYALTKGYTLTDKPVNALHLIQTS